MSVKVCILLTAALLACQAADPAGFLFWPRGVPSAEAKTGQFDNHVLSISHRDKDGQAELHEKRTDIVVVQSGEATLMVGGELVNRTSSGPNEYRGTAIKNGVSRQLSPGDIVHIPAGMPHQFFVPAGKQITYFVVKVDKP